MRINAEEVKVPGGVSHLEAHLAFGTVKDVRLTEREITLVLLDTRNGALEEVRVPANFVLEVIDDLKESVVIHGFVSDFYYCDPADHFIPKSKRLLHFVSGPRAGKTLHSD